MKILQLSDTHFFSSPEGKLCGLNTTDSLSAVIEDIQTKGKKPDWYLASGDLSQDESPVSYERLRDSFEKLGGHVYCFPGNHDDPSLMQKILNTKLIHMTRGIYAQPWQIIVLNSVVRGKNYGHLEKSELDLLKNTLMAHYDVFSLITMHHQTIPTGTAWMDTMMVDNSDQFFSVIDPFKNVKVVLSGHIHQEFQGERNGVLYLGTPSTSIQFTPKSEKFHIDSVSPGYRWIDLKDDGSIETRIERAQQFKFIPDQPSKGY